MKPTGYKARVLKTYPGAECKRDAHGDYNIDNVAPCRITGKTAAQAWRVLYSRICRENLLARRFNKNK